MRTIIEVTRDVRPSDRALIRRMSIMRRLTIALTAAVAAVMFASAQAEVSAEEAKQLGSTLTTFGAEMAGNQEGTIPSYTGGLTTPPPGFVQGEVRPDPFADEKPLFSITAKGMGQYADKLSEGTKALFAKFPDTYRADVYKTHRTAAYPKWVQENQVKNASRCKTVNDGLSLAPECYGGTPFPIPKTGYEAMWNHLTKFSGYYTMKVDNYDDVYVAANGKMVITGTSWTIQGFPYYNPDATGTDTGWIVRTDVKGPARVAGGRDLLIDPLDWEKGERKAWQYLPGQRRVRLAPDLAYDTPIPNRGGGQTFDDALMFNGKMDRFDFKLIEKKELYIPYNTYKFLYHTTNEDVFTPNHPNPDHVRWELHRVWVVEATLKPGKRHVYHKRVFYLDEDSWGIVQSDQYDAAGKMYRVGTSYCAPRYEVPAPTCGDLYLHIDLVNGVYAMIGRPGTKGSIWDVPPLPAREITPGALSGGGIR